MKKAILVGNRDKEGVRGALDRVEDWLSRHLEVRFEPKMEDLEEAGEADFALVLGGDGSVLSAARRLAPLGLPLLGINVGKFGFLTEGAAENFEDVLTDVLEGRFEVAERIMLHCTLYRDGEAMLETPGLNDAVVSRTALSRIMTIDLRVNGDRVTTYRADGLIVSTPVGSTAHSLAAGGPIMHPEMGALLVTPICPHTLSNRPLLLPSNATLTISTPDFAEPPALTVDGQVSQTLTETDRVELKRFEKPLLLIRTGRNTFFETLRNKLDWRGQPRYV